MTTRTDKAYDLLRQGILSSEIAPGTRLAELVWAGRLGVGRAAVRESLRRLDGEGLVVKEKAGYRVTLLAPQQVHEVRQLREILETGALRLAGPVLKPVALRAIQSACDDFSLMVRKGYHSGACEADLRFHRALVAASGNDRLLRLYERSNLPVFQIRTGVLNVDLEDATLTLEDHEGICLALKRGKIEEAIRRLKRHLWRGATEIVVPYLRNGSRLHAGNGNHPVKGRP